MSADPIVEEVRAARDAFARENDYDLKKIVEALRKLPLPHGAQTVSLPPKKVSKEPTARKSA